MIKLGKMCLSTAENLYNFGAYQIIEIPLVLFSPHMVPTDQDKFVISCQ